MAGQSHRSDWLSVVVGPSAPKSDPGLFIRFPQEITISIILLLGQTDLKTLRLTCKLFERLVPLSFERVYLSPNPTNIEAFVGIASSDTFRHGVVEIVYDDAVLDSRSSVLDYVNEPAPPFWYQHSCKKNREDLYTRTNGHDVNHPGHAAIEKQLRSEIPPNDSWAYYKRLIHQQEEVVASDADIHAFRYGLERFTSLKRIIITPVAHGVLFMPLYKTPMIRKMPLGLNYPLPRGWPCAETSVSQADVGAWDNEFAKRRWRGFCFVMRLLAERSQHHSVSELVLDVNQVQSGINCHIFDQPCEEYHNLVTLLRKPGFRRLDLPLVVGEMAREDWRPFRSGLLRQALSEARDLREFSLETSMCWDPGHGMGPGANFVPLRSIFPLESWQHLTSFRLSRFFVMRSDLVAFLAAMPPTLRSVELSFLMFLGNGGYWDLLNDMRTTLDWRKRDRDSRPRVIICTEMRGLSGQGLWIDEEAGDFLYRGGRNPFEQDFLGSHNLLSNTGVYRDAFQPAYERPNLHMTAEELDAYMMAPVENVVSPYQEYPTLSTDFMHI